MNILHKTDRYIERLVRTPHTKVAVFFVAFLEATISPVLPEAFLALILAYRKDISWKLLSAVSALGSAVGSLAMYSLGYFLYGRYGASLLQLLHGEDLVEKARSLFNDNAFVAQFIASLTPLPDRVFSFLAGAFGVSLVVVFIATFMGRFLRAGIAAYLSYEYGDEARVYIRRHTKTATVAIVVGLLFYIVYKYAF